LEGFGSTDAARAEHIRRAQDDLLGWARTSPLPLCVIDTAAKDWDAYACRVTDLLTV
jgi:hypothetical protein